MSLAVRGDDGDRLSMKQRLLNVFVARSIADLKSPVFWRDVIIECIMCAYFGCLVIWLLVTCNKDHYQISTTHTGIFAAFLIFALIEAWFPLCGGLLNPSAVLGFFLAGRLSFARAVLCTFAEIAGVSAGAMIGFNLCPEAQQEQLHAPKPNAGLSDGQGMVIEAIVTFHLVFVALSCTNSRKHSPLAALAIGCCKGSGLMAAGTHTGGLQNPIVPFGPALAKKDFDRHFVVYWIGPYLGGIAAAILYRVAVVIADKYPKPAVAPPVHRCVDGEDGEAKEMMKLKE